MRAEAVQHDDLGMSFPLDAENSNAGPLLDKTASECVLRLPADDEHCVLPILDGGDQMMDDSAELAHPTRRNDHAGLVASVNRFGIFDG